MEISKSLLEEFLKDFQQQHQDHIQTLNAVAGAIQFCEKLIQKVDEPVVVSTVGDSPNES